MKNIKYDLYIRSVKYKIMKLLRLGLLFFTLILLGCKSEFDKFNEQAFYFGATDKHIDQKEYETLLDNIASSNDRGLQQFKDADGKINNAKVVAYLLKYFERKKIKLTDADIWQAETQVSKNDSFNINVFLENSASMDGYVKGVTEFETAVYNLLGDFKISGLCDSLNLNYINKNILDAKKNALAPDIQDFIEKLEPSTFRLRGGDRSVSDLKNILSTVLKSVNKKNAAVLISDFVFSPGANANAQDYLNNQSVGIKIDFADKLKSYDLSVVIIQLQSNFEGIYYDKTDSRIPIACKRPYYIWILGSMSQIKDILNKKILENIKGGYTNKLIMQSIKEVNNPEFRIQTKSTFGSYDRTDLAKGIISNARISSERLTKGLFGFDVAVDFSNSLQDQSYFTDTANYILSDPNYQIEAVKIEERNSPSLTGYTHFLKLKTEKLIEEPFKIDVVGRTPSWVDISSSTDDSNIGNDESEKRKTFGFKFVVDGVSNAFYPKSQSNVLYSLNLTIKR